MWKFEAKQEGRWWVARATAPGHDGRDGARVQTPTQVAVPRIHTEERALQALQVFQEQTCPVKMAVDAHMEGLRIQDEQRSIVRGAVGEMFLRVLADGKSELRGGVVLVRTHWHPVMWSVDGYGVRLQYYGPRCAGIGAGQASIERLAPNLFVM